MTRAAIFDLDGTLLDTLTSLAATFNRTLVKLGYPDHPVDAYRYFIGDGLRACVERCLPDGIEDERVIQQFTDIQQADYEANWREHVVIYDGIGALLNELASQNVSLAVLSNKPHHFTVRCVAHFFPDTPFRVVQGHEPPLPHKPEPAGALRVAQHLKVEPSECFYLGDTATDMQTAVRAGMFAMGALWGFREADELRSAGADVLCAHPRDAWSHIKEQLNGES